MERRQVDGEECDGERERGEEREKENVRNSIRPNFIRILSADPENRTTGINQDLRESLIVSRLYYPPKPKKEVSICDAWKGKENTSAHL